MSRKVQLRRGSSAIDSPTPAAYTGPSSELISDEDLWVLRLQDNSTAGGHIIPSSPVSVIYGGTGQTAYTDGQLLIGNSSSGGLTKATLTAGTGVTITNGHGSITIAAPLSGAIADGNVLANISGSSAAAIGNTLTAILDHVFGSTQGFMLRRGSSVWAAEASPFDVPVFFSGLPTASSFIRVAITRAASIPSGGTNSVALAKNASTGTVSFTINQISGGVTTARGTIQFAASATGTFSIGSTITLVAGDLLEFVAPSSADATLSDIAITVQGSRS